MSDVLRLLAGSFLVLGATLAGYGAALLIFAGLA